MLKKDDSPVKTKLKENEGKIGDNREGLESLHGPSKVDRELSYHQNVAEGAKGNLSAKIQRQNEYEVTFTVNLRDYKATTLNNMKPLIYCVTAFDDKLTPHSQHFELTPKF